MEKIIFENSYLCVYSDRRAVLKFDMAEEEKKYKYKVKSSYGDIIYNVENPEVEKKNGLVPCFCNKGDFKYLGTVRDGKLDGEGILYYSMYNLYTGKFKDDKYEGESCLISYGDIIVGKIKKCEWGKASTAIYENATLISENSIIKADEIEIKDRKRILRGSKSCQFQEREVIEV